MTANNWTPWTKNQMAARVAHDIKDGAVVNLGIGMPTLVANHLPAGREVMMHSENGVIGMGPAPPEGEEDYDLINAGKQPVTLLPGGANALCQVALRHEFEFERAGAEGAVEVR